jgi:hypothetical protein
MKEAHENKIAEFNADVARRLREVELKHSGGPGYVYKVKALKILLRHRKVLTLKDYLLSAEEKSEPKEYLSLYEMADVVKLPLSTVERLWAAMEGTNVTWRGKPLPREWEGRVAPRTQPLPYDWTRPKASKECLPEV